MEMARWCAEGKRGGGVVERRSRAAVNGAGKGARTSDGGNKGILGMDERLGFLEGLKLNFKKILFSHAILNSRKRGQICYYWRGGALVP